MYMKQRLHSRYGNSLVEPGSLYLGTCALAFSNNLTLAPIITAHFSKIEATFIWIKFARVAFAHTTSIIVLYLLDEAFFFQIQRQVLVP
jgi:hypothetical protein